MLHMTLLEITSNEFVIIFCPKFYLRIHTKHSRPMCLVLLLPLVLVNLEVTQIIVLFVTGNSEQSVSEIALKKTIFFFPKTVSL